MTAPLDTAAPSPREHAREMAQALLQTRNTPLQSAVLQHHFMQEELYGLIAQQLVEPYLALHAQLVARGHMTEDTAVEVGTDSYLWVVADQEGIVTSKSAKLAAVLQGHGVTPSETLAKATAKAFVLQTQSQNFFVLLNQELGEWTLHIREFFADLVDTLACARHMGALEEYRGRTDLTLLDVAELSKTMAENYADDLPGVRFPSRVSLKTLLSGSLIAGNEEASLGLQCAHFADPGYVVSLSKDSRHPRVENASYNNWSALDNVTQRLAFAMTRLNELAV